jgi:hypothetical protein
MFNADAEALEAAMESVRADARRRLAQHGPDAVTDHERLFFLDLPTREEERAAEARQKRIADQEREALRDKIESSITPKGITLRPESKRLRDHGAVLLGKHRITVRRLRGYGGGGCAHQETREIECPPVTNADGYATLVHEIGHIVCMSGDSRQFRNLVAKVDGTGDGLVSPDGEVGAWTWGVANSLEWRREMQDHMYGSLVFYSEYATPAERARMVDLVKNAALLVVDQRWTSEELEEKCARLSGVTPPAQHNKIIEEGALRTAPLGGDVSGILAEMTERMKAVELDRLNERVARYDLQEQLDTLKRETPRDEGVWRSGRTYSKGAIVSHAGSAWICNGAHTATGTRPDANFKLLVKSRQDT